MINFDNLIGNRNGIINNVFQTEVDVSEPEIFSYVAIRGFLKWEKNSIGQDFNLGSGAGLRKDQALASAYGEVVERYCSSFVDANKIKGSYNNLKKNYSLIDPSTFNYFSELQYKIDNFPFEEVNQNTVLEWVLGKENDRRNVYIPAFCIYLPYEKYLNKKQNFLVMSTGLACANKIETAYQKGILEIIERDAFTNFWINQISPPILELPNTPKYNNLKRIFKFNNIEYIVLDITSDFKIPTIAVFLFQILLQATWLVWE